MRKLTSAVRSWLFVLQSGLITTAIALLGVWLLKQWKDFDSMSLFIEYVIPAGALAVGLVASIGYIWASWFTGLRINRTVFISIIIVQIAAYFAAHYLQYRSQDWVYRDTGRPIGFWHFFHLATISWTWTGVQLHDEPLGYVGYVFRLLEIAGFVLAVVLVPLVMSSIPHCHECQRYKRSREFGYAPIVPTHSEHPTSESDAPSIAAENAIDLRRLGALVQASDGAGLRALLATFTSRSAAAEKSEHLCTLTLSWCPSCLAGDLSGVTIQRIDGERTVDIVPKIELPPELVEAIRT